jgi:hypothetical protein
MSKKNTGLKSKKAMLRRSLPQRLRQLRPLRLGVAKLIQLALHCTMHQGSVVCFSGSDQSVFPAKLRKAA